jgi:hypothetical protein
MDHGTEVDVVQLDENTTRLHVPQGIVNIHFSTPPVNGTVEVLTPAGPIELTNPGTYHIDSGQPVGGIQSAQVQVTPLEGQLEIRGPHSLLEVMPGETAILNGNPPNFSLIEGNPTAFDNWALARERREEAHRAAEYVSPHMTGYEDLDYYGQWTSDPTYGTVWYPTVVQSGWAPYRYGHWAYVAPWGWTWVDDAAWGFAPFHYGRWALLSNRWCWVPGTLAERPVYAPALVAFVGGAGWNVSITSWNVNSTPAIGWVPLGPREVFHPYYPVSTNYLRNVNFSNVDRREINNITVNNIHNVNVTNYINKDEVTVVPAHTFQQGQPVHKSFVQVSHDQLTRAPMTQTLAHLPPADSALHEGHQVSPSAQEQMPHSGALINGNPQQAASPQIVHVTPVTQEHATTIQTPEAPRTPAPPTTPKVVHLMESHDTPAEHHEENIAQAQMHAPGPQVHQGDIQEKAHEFLPPPTARAPLPKADVPHPEQHTHIAPTPQGWQRTPQSPHEAPHAIPLGLGEQKHEDNR